MRLPLPGPRDVMTVLERGGEQVEALLGLVPRAVALLDQAEVLLASAATAVVRVQEVTEEAAVVVGRAGDVADRAGKVVNGAATQVARIEPLLAGMEGPLARLQPTLETLAETTDPDEVAALVRMVDHLPELTTRLERDVLPTLETLGSVAPDLHDLLTVARELNDMLAKVPGLGRIKRRIEEQEGEDDTDATVRD